MKGYDYLVQQPESSERPENIEKTRTPYGTSKQVGSGLYLVSSYVSMILFDPLIVQS